MAKEVEKIGELLKKRVLTPTNGVVQSVTGNKMIVSTSKGSITGTRAGTDIYRVGDRVSLLEGVVTGKITSGSGTTVYLV